MTNELTSAAIADAALIQMRATLVLLDSSDLPADVGAHVDLAIVRLETYVSQLNSMPLRRVNAN